MGVLKYESDEKANRPKHDQPTQSERVESECKVAQQLINLLDVALLNKTARTVATLYFLRS